MIGKEPEESGMVGHASWTNLLQLSVYDCFKKILVDSEKGWSRLMLQDNTYFLSVMIEDWRV